MTEPLRIATRKSRLALWQAEHTAALLREHDPETPVELVHVSTEGDRDQSQPLEAFGGVGVFTREVQRAVLDGRADLAVHSLKDLPTVAAEGLVLAGVPGRGPVRDCLVLPKAFEGERTLESLPDEARIGTGSLRRQAQLRHHRPELDLGDVRGNVETRLRKLDEGEYHALLLAEAGLVRLELADRIDVLLEPPLMFHAVGQGALGLECRADDEATIARLRAITHAPTETAVVAERALLADLRAGCHAPVGVATAVEEGACRLTGVVLSADGTQRIEITESGDPGDPAAVGRLVADRLRAEGAAGLLGDGEAD